MLSSWSNALASPALLCVGGGVALLLYALLAPDARQRALAPLPCPPSTLPVLGNTLDLMALQLPRLHDWILEQCLLHGGKTWRLQALGAPPLVVVSSVACFEDVLKTQFEVFDKGARMNAIFEDIMGEGIIAVDGDKWKRQRKALTHLFTMRQFRESICGAIAAHVRELGRVLGHAAAHQERGAGAPFFPLGDAFQRYAFDTFTEIAFGLEERTLGQLVEPDAAAEPRGDAKSDAFLRAMTEVTALIELRFHQPDWLWQLKRWLNVGTETRVRAAIAQIDAKVYDVVHRTLARSAAAASRRDVLSLMLDNMPDLEEAERGPQELSKFLRDAGFAMLGAGKESTGATLGWCMVMLARVPRAVDAVRRELQANLPQLFTDREFVPSMDDVESRLVYLEAVVRETLRLCPAAPLNAKEANRDVTLCDGTFMKQGTRVYIPSYAMARMPSVWGADAAEFKPERWLELDASSATTKLRSVSSFQFVAFHAGPRICLGMRFALVELKTTLAYVLSKFDFELEKPGHAYTYEMAITYALKGELRARVRPLATTA